MNSSSSSSSSSFKDFLRERERERESEGLVVVCFRQGNYNLGFAWGFFFLCNLAFCLEMAVRAVTVPLDGTTVLALPSSSSSSSSSLLPLLPSQSAAAAVVRDRVLTVPRGSLLHRFRKQPRRSGVVRASGTESESAGTGADLPRFSSSYCSYFSAPLSKLLCLMMCI